MFQNQTISSLDRQIPSIIMLINTQTDFAAGSNGIYKVHIKIDQLSIQLNSTQLSEE